MRYFPVNLDVWGRRAVVIGGGAVALRKAESLLEAGAKVKVVAPEVLPKLARLAEPARLAKGRRLVVKKRGYRKGDLAGVFLAVAATDDRPVNLKIRREATDRGVLLNIVDHPEFCDYVFPSRLNRGEFLLTVSTGGSSPALAKKIRQELERRFGWEYGKLTALLGTIRGKIPPGNRRKYESRFSGFVRSPVLNLIRRGDRRGVQRLVRKYFGRTL